MMLLFYGLLLFSCVYAQNYTAEVRYMTPMSLFANNPFHYQVQGNSVRLSITVCSGQNFNVEIMDNTQFENWVNRLTYQPFAYHSEYNITISTPCWTRNDIDFHTNDGLTVLFTRDEDRENVEVYLSLSMYSYCDNTGCRSSMLANGVCESTCNHEDCHFDGNETHSDCLYTHTDSGLRSLIPLLHIHALA